ncbi:MAG: hypothetical protein Q4C47_06525, partial [Planctomycetia bacterium]|nr:hypothetical protein [Planctomycetia bacterium]
MNRSRQSYRVFSRTLLSAVAVVASLPGVGFFVTPGFSQGTRADYERAASLESRFQAKVLNESLYHQWLGDTSRFWYAVEKPEDRREYFLFDPDSPDSEGPIRPLFDRSRLATALAESSGHPVDPDALPNR